MGILSIGTYFLNREKDKWRENANSLTTLYNLEKQAVRKWKDAEGQSRARAQTAEATAEALNSYLPELREEFDGLKKELQNLETYISTTLTTTGEVSAQLTDTLYIYRSDTIRAQTFEKRDTWSYHRGIVFEDSVQLSYEIKDSVSFVTYWEGRNIFRRGTLQIEGISYNPNTTISGLRNIKIPPPRRRKISIGPSIQYGIDANGEFNFNFGFSVQYSLIRL